MTGAAPELVKVAVMSVSAGCPGVLVKAKPTRTPSLSNTVIGGKAGAAAGAGAPKPRSASGSDAAAAVGAGVSPRPNKSCAHEQAHTSARRFSSQDVTLYSLCY